MGDLLVMERESRAVVHVLFRGVSMVEDGKLVKEESFLARSNRLIHLAGRKDEQENSFAEATEATGEASAVPPRPL